MTVVLADRAADAPSGSPSSEFRDAIVRTVAYADVFDFALTRSELHRYLIGRSATRAEVVEALEASGDGRIDERISFADGLVTLAGREHLAARRRSRSTDIARLWPNAVRYARVVGSLPFVRMVAVSGALAASNAIPGDDIDVFVVTESGRLWLARASAIAVVRLAQLEGHELCPNYLVAETDLTLDQYDLYDASELGRMVPIVGRDVYDRMRAANAWTSELLPNAIGAPPIADAVRHDPSWSQVRRMAERGLRTEVGSMLEAWERTRKVRRFRALAASHGGDVDAAFSAERCKGHFVSHRQRIRDAYEARCRTYGTEPHWVMPEARP